MKRIEFKNGYEDYFSARGLKSFDKLFAHAAPEWMHTKRRIVSSFTLESESDRRQMFIKRFRKPHTKDIAFAWRQFGPTCTMARYEWNCANFLLNNGIETYHPVCCGEHTSLGVERRSFLITEALTSTPLTAFVKEKWPHFSRRRKEELISRVAAFVRRIHRLKINFPDLYIWHIFVTETKADSKDPRYEFAIIDLHRMTLDEDDRKKRAQNLGRLHHSLAEEFFDKRLKDHLIESYLAEDRPEKSGDFADRLKKVSKALSARRTPKPY